MSRFGDVLFSGGPFIRWTLLPTCLLSAVVFACMAYFSISDAKIVPALIGLGLTIGCVAMCVAMLLPSCKWVTRLITGMVFAAYFAYLIHEWIFDIEKGIGVGAARSEATPKNALLGFIVIGLPCLWHTVFGRFTFRAQPHVEANENESEQSGPDMWLGQ
jgi:hypothetical protein